MRTPAEPGVTGWSDANAPVKFVYERHADVDSTTRRWPAALRILGMGHTMALPRMSEEDVWSGVKELIRPGVRTSLRRLGPDPARPENVQSVLEWVLSVPGMNTWWASTWGWRSPREFATYRLLEGQISAPHMEPYELAHWRIPDDISGDMDVLLFAAWCQGVHGRHLDLGREHTSALRNGLKKFHGSPWVMFALAAPHMQPTGVLFKDTGYLDSCARLEFLLANPFLATDAELSRIMGSRMFQIAIKTARKLRRKGEYMNPDGTWYVQCRRYLSLGPGFRRGGRWTGSRGKR